MRFNVARPEPIARPREKPSILLLSIGTLLAFTATFDNIILIEVLGGAAKPFRIISIMFFMIFAYQCLKKPSSLGVSVADLILVLGFVLGLIFSILQANISSFPVETGYLSAIIYTASISLYVSLRAIKFEKFHLYIFFIALFAGIFINFLFFVGQIYFEQEVSIKYSGLSKDPSSLGSSFSILFSFLLFMSLYRPTRIKFSFLILLAMIVLVGVIVSQSRTGTLICIFSFGCYILFILQRWFARSITNFIPLAIPVLAFCSSLLVGFWLYPEIFETRFSFAILLDGAGRYDLWAKTVPFLARFEFLPVGFDNMAMTWGPILMETQNVQNIVVKQYNLTLHNSFLSFWAAGGFIALICLVLFFWISISNIHRRCSDQLACNVLIWFIFCVVIESFFHDALIFPRTLVLLWLVQSLVPFFEESNEFS